MYKHILIPTDGSTLSDHAVAHGIALAKATGARVTGLFVAPAPTPLVFEGLVPVGYMQPDEHAALTARAAARYLGVIEKAAQQAGVPFEGVTVTGEFPADAILEPRRSVQVRPDRDGLARPPRAGRRAAGQRDAEGADARQGAGARLPLGICRGKLLTSPAAPARSSARPRSGPPTRAARQCGCPGRACPSRSGRSPCPAPPRRSSLARAGRPVDAPR